MGRTRIGIFFAMLCLLLSVLILVTVDGQFGVPDGFPGRDTRELGDFIVGSALMMIAFVMLVCSFFFKKPNRGVWLALAFVTLAAGMLIVMYSPLLYQQYGEYGGWWTIGSDLALYALFTGLCYFFEALFGAGPFGLARKLRIWMTGYSLYCAAAIAGNVLTELRYNSLAALFTVKLMGIFIILELLLLLGLSVYYAYKGNREAVIFAAGLACSAGISITELTWHIMQEEPHRLILWKWAITIFVSVLAVLHVRKLARNHDQVIQYYKELEILNNRVQRSEKMDMISVLAASIAHEVRNPLTVTRGFLQMLKRKAGSAEDCAYFDMAIHELDRASTIITDFLTFAKPQMEHVTKLRLAEEFEQIKGIIAPLAHFHGVEIKSDIPERFCVNGNAAKLKQGMINIIKNSIEAARGRGIVDIWAHEDEDQVLIHIRDNGEGIEPEVLSRLGEPYFSTKTKGTGLGLMVTFRIIEAMQGTIQFMSEKGVGTEAVLRFPLAKE